ncbi:MAG: hypothetical protein P8M87_09225 [Crocinitomicaceae bacterium]|nr:hypothetical protein [Crocinitomicaceae bacterium]MDG2506319.1 hypothetical protein [Crocinitomicaceae bacterium]
MRIIHILILVLPFLIGCNPNPEAIPAVKEKSKEQLQDAIRTMNDSLLSLYNLPEEVLRTYGKEEMIKYQTERSLARIELINRNLQYSALFPKDSLSAFCLADVQQLYDDAGAYQQAVVYGDSLALKYPNFPDLYLVLEKNAAILDFSMENRDTVRIRKAYERLLDLPSLPEAYRETYQERLSNLHLDLTALLSN